MEVAIIPKVQSGFANINNALIYYETAGNGKPFMMIHAGIADSRQWNNEFAQFSGLFRVIRYDMRGYGKSEPVEGEFSHLQDLTTLIEYLHLENPLILMGCSMGGSLAMDFTLMNPSKVKALIMVDAGPSGLDLDVPTPAKFDEIEKSYNEGDLDLVAELETQIWFDGIGRTSKQVNKKMRQLVYEMNRKGLAYDAKKLGKRLTDTKIPAAERLTELNLPVLIIIGAYDIPYILAAAEYMVDKIPSAQKVVIQDAAHLPNLDHSREFQQVVAKFLNVTL
ncbi:MAG: alpha/beta fold hydrolase [Promethearchaeota archaeon]